jgi:hypothetical protein
MTSGKQAVRLRIKPMFQPSNQRQGLLDEDIVWALIA